jgi:photosystem II stability/assembly factor-like uncharacterized protein
MLSKMKFTPLLLLLLLSFSVNAQKNKATTPAAEANNNAMQSVISGFSFREIGPAVTSGRISDIAVNPNNYSEWYIAAACGGVWKTENAGTTFKPIFDGQTSFSIGCITIDPNNTHTVWVGSGENNNQRSVAYGDGIYKSDDNGKSWKNMGLKNSEHIGMIAIHPKSSNTIFVAAYGPLWSAGGERGIYKSTDGGATWKNCLFVSENTGFNEVHFDPKNPEILYATAHQRRRHEWTYISGGPESALYKSTDGGNTWQKLENGLPKGDVGRIGLAISPVNSDYIYAMVEANDDQGGVYLSTNKGASFEKQSSFHTAGNYYMEIIPDPVNIHKLYAMDTWGMLSVDGGKTWQAMGEKNKHVDNHALWINPHNTKHKIMGCDGGLYQTWDDCKSWQYASNLPITQFYRVSVDNALPFYNIYGGTQDNNTLGGPSRTISASGIHNMDWFVTVGGDGFKSVIDPKDPNTVYSQWQYGGLVRYNRKTGEALDIKPQEKQGEPAYRYNWDAPLHLSYHHHQTLYFAAQKLFKSNDRGNTWQVISPDLSRGIDRNKLPVMGKVWSMDAVAKNQSTSIYGNITAFAESPLDSNLLYVGTDDGLIQVSEDAGKTWTKYSKFNGLPDQVLVQNIYASKHQKNVVFAVFNNHRNGDFKPYLLKSNDKGKTWQLIQSDLPERGSVQCMAEDHKNSNLLFAGTEFGIYCSTNGGNNWNKLGNNLPPIMVKEIAIQERENDLVLGTFGRGFWVLDDYSPLQKLAALENELKQQKITIFDIKDGLVFIPSTPLGHKGKSFQGESFYNAPNPAIGTSISYYLKDDYKTIKELRKEREKNNVNQYYPSKDSIRLEDMEAAPYVLVTITDAQGNFVKSMKQGAKKGYYRLVWDGRYQSNSPVSFHKPNPDNPYEGEDNGPLAIPGSYYVSFKLFYNNTFTELSSAKPFVIKSLFDNSLQKNSAFNAELAAVRHLIQGLNGYIGEVQNKINYVKELNRVRPDVLPSKINEIEKLMDQLQLELYGNSSLSRREFETLSGLVGSVEGIVWNLWATTEESTTTYKEKLAEVKGKLDLLYPKAVQLKTLVDSLDETLEKLKLPYTPGRFPLKN